MSDDIGRTECSMQVSKQNPGGRALQEINEQIYATENLKRVLVELQDRILGLLQADRMTIYVVDVTTKEIYSRFKIGNEVNEIRVPISETSIAGYVAKRGCSVNIKDAYDHHEVSTIHPQLSFDGSWDAKTGYRSTQMLVVPILFRGFTLGVLQLINKIVGTCFTTEDEESAQVIANVLGKVLHNQLRSIRRRNQSDGDPKLSKDPNCSDFDKPIGLERKDEKNKNPSRFGYLVKNHLITEEELKRATVLAEDTNSDIEEVLLRDYEVSKRDLGSALSEFYKTRFITFQNNIAIPTQLLHNLKPSYLRANLWVPIEGNDESITVLMDDPNHLLKRDMVRSLLKNSKIEFCVGLKEDITKFLDYFFESPVLEDSNNDMIALTEAEEALADEEDFIGETHSVIVQFVSKMIIDACDKGASDIHIESNPSKQNMEIRFRVDGLCIPYQKIPYHYKRAVISRLKIMADLNIAERRLPQDGKIKFKKFGSKDIELRVATLPLSGGVEDITLRILNGGEPLPLERVGFNETNLGVFKRLIEMPHGIVLVVGPTGSGKTATLHAALAHINQPERKILTAEDPVEITQPGLRQVQVRPEIGLTFASAMRSFLRHDPDVIMVGEMRDEETAQIGIQASLTGHLLLSTLHTNSAPETITRLLDMGMNSFNFADALLGILAQRLVRTLCEECKEPYHPTEEEFKGLMMEYGREDFGQLNLAYTDDLTLYKPSGCDECNQTGYFGRTAIHELLIGTDETKRRIQLNRPTREIRNQARKDGMLTLKQDGIRKVLKGITDISEVRKVCIK